MARTDELGLLRGTLDLMILKTLVPGPRHGYGIARWIRERTDGELQIDDGALYTSLHRMRNRGLLDASWGVAESQRRAKFYRLTAKGKRQLARSESDWQRYAAALSKIVNP